VVKNVYIDTSAVGGFFDGEFEFWTKFFFDLVRKGEFKIVISELPTLELRFAPVQVQTFLNKLPESINFMWS